MPLNTFVKHLSAKGKDIYVVDDHHKALALGLSSCRSLDFTRQT